MEFYRCKHFQLHELVDKAIFQLHGETAWQFLDPRILFTIDRIRERYNAGTIVNNWFWNGNFQNRGYRGAASTVGATNSQHKHGRGIDFHIPKVASHIIRDDIKKNPFCEDFQYITSIEDFSGMSWVHVDCRNWDKEKNGLLIFNK